MKKLHVIYGGWGERWRLGTLADNGANLLFEYSSGALRQGLELSPRCLKLRLGAYGDFPAHQLRLPGLVYDALPDGWGLLLMDRLFRQLGRNPATLSPLERLAFIGERALGALSFEPAQDQALAAQPLQLFTLAQEVQALISGQDSDALRQLALLGASPQGERPKVLLNYDVATGQVNISNAAPGQPWLMKFQAQGEHKEACAVEDLYAHLARECALEVPATRYIDLSPELACFGIERFDRQGGLRVPMHTLAAALHANFRVPGAVDYTTFLRATRLFTRDEREVQKAFERAVFNVVFNNRDDHGKNFSFRPGFDRRWTLAPCYDLSYNEGPAGEHQMDICGEGRAPARQHLLQLASQGGIDAGFAASAIECVTEVASRFNAVASQWPIRSSTLKTLRQAIAGNSQRLR